MESGAPNGSECPTPYSPTSSGMEQRRYSTKGDYGGKRLRRSGMDAGLCGHAMLAAATGSAGIDLESNGEPLARYSLKRR